MKTRLLLLIAVVLAMAPAPRPDDKDAIQGMWMFFSGERNGEPPSDDVKAMKLTFKDDKLTATLRDEVKETGKFQIDTTRKPKEITITPATGKEIRGIYDLNDDTLRICLGPPDGDRPKEFNGKDGSRNALMVFKRAP